MLFDLIAAVAAGFCLAGLALSLRWLARGRAPLWIVPAAAGLGMLSYALWSEYSWLDRAEGSLPDGVVVASSNQSSAWYRPWTLAWPQADRLIAVDRRAERRNEALPSHVLSSVLLMGRWQPTRQIAVMFDCEGLRRADLIDGVRFDEQGLPLGAQWRSLDADDPVLRAACAG
jgi:hypothetical protein